MKRTLTACCLALCIAAPGTLLAEHYDRYPPDRYVWADVVRVEPIVQRSQRPIQREVCWNEPVAQRYGRRSDQRAPAILGALVGGVIGNQFGDGHGRDAATVAGAALGYHAVRDAQRRHDRIHGPGGYPAYVQRCSLRTDYVWDDSVTGYQVTYRYHGRYLRTTTREHPGDQVLVPGY